MLLRSIVVALCGDGAAGRTQPAQSELEERERRARVPHRGPGSASTLRALPFPVRGARFRGRQAARWCYRSQVRRSHAPAPARPALGV